MKNLLRNTLTFLVSGSTMIHIVFPLLPAVRLRLACIFSKCATAIVAQDQSEKIAADAFNFSDFAKQMRALIDCPQGKVVRETPSVSRVRPRTPCAFSKCATAIVAEEQKEEGKARAADLGIGNYTVCFSCVPADSDGTEAYPLTLK